MLRTKQIIRNEAAEQVRRFKSYPTFPAPASPELEELIESFVQASALAGRARIIGDRLVKTLEFAPRPKHVWDAANEISGELTTTAAAIPFYDGNSGESCALCSDTGFAPQGYGSWREAMAENALYRFAVACSCKKVARDE